MNLISKEYEKIYQEYYQRVYMFLYRLCCSSETAEELTSKTFLEAYSSFLARLRDESKQCTLYIWLLMVAKDVFLEYLRSSEGSYVTLDIYVLNPDSPITEEAGYRITKRIRAERLSKTLLSMPERYTDVLMLKIYAELSFKDIADNLEISELTAKNVFFRAKQRIKEELLNENV